MPLSLFFVPIVSLVQAPPASASAEEGTAAYVRVRSTSQAK